MYRHVAWEHHIKPLMKLMKAQYEKCNIWPMWDSEDKALRVLRSEIEEAKKHLSWVEESMIIVMPVQEADIDEIRSHLINVLLETLQCISVVDKWDLMRSMNKNTLSKMIGGGS